MSDDVLSRRFFNIPITAVVLSACLHFTLVGLLLLSPALEKLGIQIFPKKDIFNEAYQSFIQVDVVALPDELPGEKTQIDTSLPMVEKVATEVEPDPKIDELKPEDISFPDAMKAEELKKAEQAKKLAEAEGKKRQSQIDQALKKVQEEAKREQALKALQNKAGQKGRKKLSGNIMSKGTALTGAVGTSKDQFTARIVEAIKQNFNLYLWQNKKKGLAVVIHLEFFPTGKVRKRDILRRSIDPTYDSAVLQAIDATSFPVPEDPTILEDAYNITFVP